MYVSPIGAAAIGLKTDILQNQTTRSREAECHIFILILIHNMWYSTEPHMERTGVF